MHGEDPQNTPTSGLGGYNPVGNKHWLRVQSSPDFLDGISEQLQLSGEPRATVRRASHLIRVVDSKDGLAKKRTGMRGSEGMSRGDRTVYRQRVYVTAILMLMHQSGIPNRHLQIASEWGIHHWDLMRALKFLGSLVDAGPSQPRQGETPEQFRSRLYEHWLNLLFEHLAEQLDHETSAKVAEIARRILRESGEPLDYGDEHHNGRFSHTSPARASMRAMFEAIRHLGMPPEVAKRLHSAVPISGMTTLLSKLGHFFAHREHTEEEV